MSVRVSKRIAQEINVGSKRQKTPNATCSPPEKTKGRMTNQTHGMSGTRLYRTWVAIKERCDYPKHASFKNYGALGITYCAAWARFEAFRDWAISSGYDDALQIDRKETTGDYCPENCRWVTAKVNSNNKRNNRCLTIDGRTQTVAMWRQEMGLPRALIYLRLSKGWTARNAVMTPVIAHRDRYPDLNRRMSQ